MIGTQRYTESAKQVQGPRRELGLAGRVAVLWAMAGGVALGGFGVAAMTLLGRLSANGLFLTSGAMFLIGAVLGLVHGGVLGYFGREGRIDSTEATRKLGLAALYAIPALAFAWVAAGWIAMTVVASYAGGTGLMIGSALGWTAGAALVAAAAWQGWKALRNAYDRWPARRAGTFLVAATFAALVVTFLADRPELWGFELTVTPVGGVLLAAAISLWFVGPAVTIALRLFRRLPEPGLAVGFGGDGKALTGVALGLAAGLVLGLLALPFHQPPAAVPGVGGEGVLGGLALAVSEAMVNEVLLRLTLMTGLAWLLVRWHDLHREEVGLMAIAGVAVLQVALYAPALGAVGFSSIATAATYALVGVLVPAAVFGALYWFRGFGTALLADATALGVLVLLA